MALRLRVPMLLLIQFLMFYSYYLIYLVYCYILLYFSAFDILPFLNDGTFLFVCEDEPVWLLILAPRLYLDDSFK